MKTAGFIPNLPFLPVTKTRPGRRQPSDKATRSDWVEQTRLQSPQSAHNPPLCRHLVTVSHSIRVKVGEEKQRIKLNIRNTATSIVDKTLLTVTGATEDKGWAENG